jgi:hypothetical protein
MITNGFGVEDRKLCPIKVSESLGSFCSITFGYFLGFPKVGQEYSSQPTGMELTGKFIPQFAPTGNFL